MLGHHVCYVSRNSEQHALQLIPLLNDPDIKRFESALPQLMANYPHWFDWRNTMLVFHSSIPRTLAI
jgi:hypothetical protein